MHRFVIGRNAGGVVSEAYIDGDDNKIGFRDVQGDAACRAILDANSRRRLNGHNPRAVGRLSHSIPVTLWYRWRQEYFQNAKRIMSWHEFRRRKLNSREFSQLRAGSIKRV